ncbi:NAD-dependent succinate-semialdehyde dehydrogenase [Tanticharoenia sakaeratensis]|uniref:Aldehyde dehydrogenase (NAD) family protein n=1 Tax=Tanticharoenia sakaeratensis NBRC 103193 TaxID=1231623 RepID=A0A0D6MMM5_9PROT|nr:NAD-dependent succinate-semialdehyde dehydrogenase [Tanticharoenia sakaeratensis]GAN54675.1 aldehyde dehydrogenase (NAD) family protein [Tanticharoenia sakaeratensis NBRC 103193]GBQ16782.1 aldehyde dehydrogenase [Tanticharoenia sakaeratensis NBRC 103193]
MTYQTINPFTEQTVKVYTGHTDAESFDALDRADAAFRSPDWGQGPIENRLAVLSKIADLFELRAEELAQAASVEMGKRLADAKEEVKLCGGIARYYAEHAKEQLKRTPCDTPMGDAWIENAPIGTLVAVEPWNFPFYQLVRVVAPAFAVGNSVLIKHAEIVPHCAVLFEALVRDAGAPDGACVNLFITPDQVAALIADDRVQGVALTGSERAGAAVASTAAKYLKKSTMELGGMDIFAVLDDADLARAIKIGAVARLSNAGQVCTAAKRFVVHERVAEKFVSGLKAEFERARMGDPLDKDTTLQPMSSKGALETITKQVDEAVKHGAQVVTGGKAASQKGFFYEPTILTGIDKNNPAFKSEFFGPVAQVYVVKDDDELVTLANDSPYGLGGSVFSSDHNRATALASRIDTGMVFINQWTSTAPELPFGGVKRSGYGRELGNLGIMEFVNRKLVVVAPG